MYRQKERPGCMLGIDRINKRRIKKKLHGKKGIGTKREAMFKRLAIFSLLFNSFFNYLSSLGSSEHMASDFVTFPNQSGVSQSEDYKKTEIERNTSLNFELEKIF